MATRALGKRQTTDWRAAFRRSCARALEIGGAVALGAAALFLALALVSYSASDPSPSTAASGADIANWMGAAGAVAAERVLLLFGIPGALFVPLLALGARRLWRAEDGALPGRPAWRPVLLLTAGAVLAGTVLTVLFEGPGSALPAQGGGLAGLLGARAVGGIAALAPSYAPAISAALTLLCAIAAAALVTRVFAIDWRRRLSRLAGSLANRRSERLVGREPADASDGKPEAAATAPRPVPAPMPARRAPEISEPGAAPRQAGAAPAAQGDMFADFQLPSIDLLEAVPATAAPKLDKLALERNARLLETVLDDFNVKGEITAVRTGPVVTMYELEPAPGIKASRVVGLAEDIARNMSAISARVSAIPGKTVMGIELPNAQRQTVSFRELAASADFVETKGNLPMILGKDIAGEPIIADLAAMPHLLVAGTTGSGKSVGLNCILLSLLYRFTPAECRLILVDPKVLELKIYDDIPHLLSPVVTEPAKSVRALKWAVEEMERRYRMMSSVGSRNIGGFNEKVRAAKAKGKPLGRR
ncbi:MAG: DNA translocase FtsK 4TM domain-containing protein, partial [Erythrobacter sp.]|nr:DNA translocase FtsK 4TM domain-containing protein [Erythrobacter sp.]